MHEQWSLSSNATNTKFIRNETTESIESTILSLCRYIVHTETANQQKIQFQLMKNKSVSCTSPITGNAYINSRVPLSLIIRFSIFWYFSYRSCIGCFFFRLTFIFFCYLPHIIGSMSWTTVSSSFFWNQDDKPEKRHKGNIYRKWIAITNAFLSFFFSCCVYRQRATVLPTPQLIPKKKKLL